MTMVETLLTQHMNLWTSAIKRKSSAGRGSSKKIELYGIRKLRELILELAVRGLLVPQDPNDEPASELLKKIAAEKAKLVKEGKIKKEKPLPAITEEDIHISTPPGWQAIRLGEIAQVIRGVSYQKQDAHDTTFEGSIPLLRANNINVELNFQDLLHLPSAIVRSEQIINRGDILIAMSSGSADLVGKAAQAREDLKSTFGAFCAVLRPLSESLFAFLGFFCATPFYRSQTQATGKGIGIQNLNKSGLELITVVIPPLSEQHRIVAKVDELMALCDQLEQQTEDSLAAHQTLVETLLNALTQAPAHPIDASASADGRASTSSARTAFDEAWQRIADHFDILFSTEQSIDQLKQTILQLAVMGKLVPQSPSDEPASELLKKIAAEKAKLVKEGKIKKEKPLPPITEEEKPFALPEGWEWVLLKTISKIGTGATPARDNSSYYSPPEFSWVTSGETSQPFISETREKISSKAIAETNVTIYPPGTLIVAMYGQGKTRGQITELLIPAGTNQACAAIQLTELAPFHRAYIKIYFQKAYEAIRSIAEGGAQPNLNIGKISETAIPLPPLPEQHRIVAKVDELMALCDQLKARLNDAQTTQLHLADAMTEQALAS